MYCPEQGDKLRATIIQDRDEFWAGKFVHVCMPKIGVDIVSMSCRLTAVNFYYRQIYY